MKIINNTKRYPNLVSNEPFCKNDGIAIYRSPKISNEDINNHILDCIDSLIEEGRDIEEFGDTTDYLSNSIKVILK